MNDPCVRADVGAGVVLLAVADGHGDRAAAIARTALRALVKHVKRLMGDNKRTRSVKWLSSVLDAGIGEFCADSRRFSLPPKKKNLIVHQRLLLLRVYILRVAMLCSKAARRCARR